jgi:RNA polymerase sigma-70 factor (ECF subfamily)
MHPEPVATPEHSMIAEQESQKLQTAVCRLPIPYRQVITLVLEGLSHAEIAETLALGVSNVAVRINRAKTKLQELLDE